MRVSNNVLVPAGEEACAIDKFADVAATVKITDQENLQFDVGENSQPGVLFTVATNGALGGFSDYLQFDLEHTNEGKFDLEIFQLLLTSGFDLDDPEAKNLYTVTINCLFSPDYGVVCSRYDIIMSNFPPLSHEEFLIDNSIEDGPRQWCPDQKSDLLSGNFRAPTCASCARIT